jgi:cytochrome c oxidase subunit 2
MRLIGLKTAMLAAGLMLAGAGHAAPQANSAMATTPSTTGAPAPATVPPSNDVKPAGTNPTAAPTPTADPEMLAMDGAPAMLPAKGIGDAVDGGIGIQPQVTKNGERARAFHDGILVPVIAAISLLVLFLLMWVVFRYRAGTNPVPSKTTHNTTIEVIWTLVPVLALVLIAIPSIGLLSAQFKPPPKNAITLKVTGNQWYWTYTYPDNGGFEVTANMLKEKDEVAGGERARTDADGPRLLAVDNRVVLPVGVPIRLITTSADVIHSWAVPAFWLKLDAVPGRLNETSFTIEKPGLYFGQCSELCGPRHVNMPIAVEAVPLAVFNRWVVAKGGTVAGAPPAASVSDNAAVEATAGPTVNATDTPPTTNQPASANPGQ